jgi:hypothetical protein
MLFVITYYLLNYTAIFMRIIKLELIIQKEYFSNLEERKKNN